ncbi:MAG: aldehyde ferredoxin oxidoreductase family protein [Chloroflexota bacterium]|nr:aldehyde ferredoxin oxidoreductase family protein [Chloroflexota bacterium]
MGTREGKILEVDLTNNMLGQTIIPSEVMHDFIGGSGLAAKLFLDRVSPGIDPLSPENTLFIVAGPLVGTKVPGSARFTVCAKSPLTNIWGESSCGGSFGPELKQAGYDGIAVSGCSDKPVYLAILDGDVEIRDAAEIWGRDIYETVDILKEKVTGSKAPRILAIGPAGERLVKYAAIGNDKTDFAGRCGLGAVMGSKNLKAIAIIGTGKIILKKNTEFEARRAEVFEKVKGGLFSLMLKDHGTDVGMVAGERRGDVPAKNWFLGENFDICSKIDGITMSQKYLVKSHGCPACPIACKRVVEVKEGPYQVSQGPGPEYETCASFGSMLMIDDLPAIIRMNELCNRYGLDTISCGSTISFAMDCYEKGLITKEVTDGIELTWGNVDVVMQMIEKIAAREGYGDVLAEGSRRVAQRIGGDALDYAIEVKGLELPMHDPRAGHALGLAYATSIRGGCHLQHLAAFVESNIISCPEAGLLGTYEAKTSEGKAKLVLASENLGMVVNSAVICQFVVPSLRLHDIVDLLNMAVGSDYTLQEMLQCGERIWLLKRGLGNLMGLNAQDDRLPKRILNSTESGGAAGSVPDIELMLREYYEVRAIDSRGYPTKEKLYSLGLEDLASKL